LDFELLCILVGIVTTTVEDRSNIVDRNFEEKHRPRHISILSSFTEVFCNIEENLIIATAPPPSFLENLNPAY
jgi:hypothetical protein